MQDISDEPSPCGAGWRLCWGQSAAQSLPLQSEPCFLSPSSTAVDPKGTAGKKFRHTNIHLQVCFSRNQSVNLTVCRDCVLSLYGVSVPSLPAKLYAFFTAQVKHRLNAHFSFSISTYCSAIISITQTFSFPAKLTLCCAKILL